MASVTEGRGDLDDFCTCGTQLFDGFAEACEDACFEAFAVAAAEFLDDADAQAGQVALACGFCACLGFFNEVAGFIG